MALLARPRAYNLGQVKTNMAGSLMSRFFTSTLFLMALLVPALSHAQSTKKDQGQSSYGGFLYGQEEEEEKAPVTWQYSKKYKKNPEGTPTRILPNGEQSIYFVRTPDAHSNEAVLRLVTPASVTGCLTLVQTIVTVQNNGNLLTIKVQPGDVTVDKSVRYAHFQCNQGSNVAMADIKLNRDEILSNNVKTMRFSIDGGATDTYNVSMVGNTLTITPKTSFAFKPFMGSPKSDPLSYNFYPENALILYAPSAPRGVDLSEQIASLAQSKGMNASNVGLKNESSAYFIDQSGVLANTLAPDGNAFVGNVVAEQTFQGASGPYQQKSDIQVYARRPGLLD